MQFGTMIKIYGLPRYPHALLFINTQLETELKHSAGNSQQLSQVGVSIEGNYGKQGFPNFINHSVYYQLQQMLLEGQRTTEDLIQSDP